MNDEDGQRLPPAHDSLAFGARATVPATIFALSITGGITVKPREGRTILFGRNRLDVHVCLGETDRRVSRQQGVVFHQDGRWWVRNTGRLPVRLPGSRMLFTDEQSLPLAAGYTPLFVRGSKGREHLLELFVTGEDGRLPGTRHNDPTQPPRTWKLQEDERLALTVLGQRYLLHEAFPRPLSWEQTAELLDELQPEAGWTAKQVAHKVTAVRNRLSREGVPGLTREEVGEPVGNTLNDNLIKELVLSTTLIPPDLARLDRGQGYITNQIAM
ncbi:FHA domain-containing protein [Allokutzneria oryzae]|uniref:FHA domain-containing protein n=1 Tax=Allokutzneria oryzae TaxID=1378989 RepID=A0ABV6A5R6_9PSEU